MERIYSYKPLTRECIFFFLKNIYQSYFRSETPDEEGKHYIVLLSDIFVITLFLEKVICCYYSVKSPEFSNFAVKQRLGTGSGGAGARLR